MDWKDALAGLRSGMPEGEETQDTLAVKEEKKKQKGKLHIVIERKGRNGKTATIIEGFEGSDREIEEIARELKQKIGTGGSARGGEILLQGDWRDKAAELLRGMGFKVN